MKTVAVLFAREDSIYKTMPECDVYDIKRDARNYDGPFPIVAHPPCRAWGVLSHMANPRPDEKELAPWAISKIRKYGGVLEHPKGSRLWKFCGLPEPNGFKDEFGGYSIQIDQFDFGHVAHKDTKLYICGAEIKKLPPKNTASTDRSICGNVKGTHRCTNKQREETPPMLTEWLIELASRCKQPLALLTPSPSEKP